MSPTEQLPILPVTGTPPQNVASRKPLGRQAPSFLAPGHVTHQASLLGLVLLGTDQD